MKKFISIVCIFAMILSFCTFGVMAEESVLSGITAEKLAVSGGVNQIPSSIVASLTLPAIEGVTWESSNTAVLGNDGTVTRPMIEDADVTLTAKTATEEKTFNYTVKARTTNILHQDSFAYTDRTALFPNTNSGTRWNITGGTDTTSSLNTDNSGNKYASFDFVSNNATKRQILTAATGDVLYLSVDVKPDADNIQYMAVRVDGTDKNGKTISYNIRMGYFYKGTARAGTYENDKVAYGIYDGTKFVNFKAKIDLLNQKYYVTFDGGETTGPWTFAVQRDSGSTIDALNVDKFTSIGVVSFTSSSSGVIAVDNFSISTKTEVDDLISSLENTEKVQYVKNQIKESVLANETAGGITQNINLGDYGSVADVVWTSENPAITISDDGKTAVVTQGAMPSAGVLTATITSGDVTDTVKFPLTVAPRGTHRIRNGALEEDFESYTEGGVLSWAPQYTTDKGTVVRDSETGSLAGQFVRQGTANASRVYAWRLYNTQGNHKWTERYILSLDIKYNPGAENSKVYIRQMGVLGFNYIGLDYAKKEAILGNVGYGHGTDKRYILRDDAAMNYSSDEWVHIDIDFNAAKRETKMYVNGSAVSESPMEIADNYINPDYSMPMRGFDIGLDGEGTVLVDNVSVRAFDEAEVFDENCDFTVQKFTITNQKGETIRNIGKTTTSVKATLRVNKNRDASMGDAKMFLALYDAQGKLVEITSADVSEGTYGYSIVNAEIALKGDCTGYNAKAFLLYEDKLMALTENQDMNKEIVFDEALFSKEVNYALASDLGYSEFESTYDPNIDAIFFDGEDYLGNPTKHFAYFGVPEGASASNPVPAVVLVHGGGGTAFDEWVKIWNDRGYAAIAMDMNGKLPNQGRIKHAWAGAENEYYGSRKAVDASKDLWMYQCVTEVILAHNLLMQDERILSDKIGITGISWGGIITSTAIGVDTRFQFAVPVYGCGYLYEMDSYMGKTVLDDEMIDWDPSNFIAKANKDMPTLWINGDLDGNFAIDGFSKSAELMGDNMNIVIKPNMSHGHQAGYWVERVPEIYSFADSVVNGTDSLIKVSDPVIDGDTVTVTVSGGSANAGNLYYTESEALLYDDATGTVPEYSFTSVAGNGNGTEWTFTLPEGAKKFYVTFDYTLNGKTHKASTKFVSLN